MKISKDIYVDRIKLWNLCQDFWKKLIFSQDNCLITVIVTTRWHVVQLITMVRTSYCFKIRWKSCMLYAQKKMVNSLHSDTLPRLEAFYSFTLECCMLCTDSKCQFCCLVLTYHWLHLQSNTQVHHWDSLTTMFLNKPVYVNSSLIKWKTINTTLLEHL